MGVPPTVAEAIRTHPKGTVDLHVSGAKYIREPGPLSETRARTSIETVSPIRRKEEKEEDYSCWSNSTSAQSSSFLAWSMRSVCT